MLANHRALDLGHVLGQYFQAVGDVELGIDRVKGDVTGFSILPGSDDVWNHKAGKWETLSGGPNYAPNMAYIGWGVYVMARVDGEEINRFVRPDYLWFLHDDAEFEVETCEFGAERDRLAMRHTGYCRLPDPVLVARTLTLDHREHMLAIEDRFEGEGDHDVEIPLHLAAGVGAAIVDGSHWCTGTSADREMPATVRSRATTANTFPPSTGIDAVEAQRPDGAGRLVLEGGAIDTNGQGVLLTTEECLLSDIQERNPGLDRPAESDRRAPTPDPRPLLRCPAKSTSPSIWAHRAAGMWPVGALWGFRDREELLGHGARVLVDRPAEVLDVLDGGRLSG